ncbi:30S ribosome-binding factor RbfA [Caulobacter sp. KR2-114]|uniref:30S ribosome-binding factor RbfA n=1 Tax=Caulobacter sp. KR2-114 TaxID=3400912 RepID=UPI003C084E00
MSRHTKPDHRRPAAAGPSQRQLRAGELVRHALVEILREEEIEALNGASVTVSEVRMSPDLKHAICFVEPLGGDNAAQVVEGLNKAARFLRGRLGHAIALKFTPDLKFLHDESFDAATAMNRLLDDPRIRRDVEGGRLADVAGDDDEVDDESDAEEDAS